MKPSNFTDYPWNSVTQNSECETIARNIMVILKRTGDTWRSLSWEEYCQERSRDGAVESAIAKERPYFDKVSGFCVAPRAHRPLLQGGESDVRRYRGKG